MIRPDQSKDLWQTKVFKCMDQCRLSSLCRITVPPCLDGEAISEVYYPFTEIVMSRDARKPQYAIGGVDPADDPPAIAITGPMIKPAVKQRLSLFDAGYRPGRIEQVSLRIAENREYSRQICVPGLSVIQARGGS